jgi:hypothetical protein
MYLPYITNYTAQSPLTDHTNLYYLLNTTSWFMVILYGYLLIHRNFVGKMNDDNGVLLAFMYNKYISDIIYTVGTDQGDVK